MTTPKSSPRPKHTPQRSCVICRTKTDKRLLTRIVATPSDEGETVVVMVDLTGKKNGRGAYVCQKVSCRQRAVTTAVLDGALKTSVSAEAKARIAQFWETHEQQPVS